MSNIGINLFQQSTVVVFWVGVELRGKRRFEAPHFVDAEGVEGDEAEGHRHRPAAAARQRRRRGRSRNGQDRAAERSGRREFPERFGREEGAGKVSGGSQQRPGSQIFVVRLPVGL